MRDYRSIEQIKPKSERHGTAGVELCAPIDIPSSKIRKARRKRRSRPAVERFHGM